MSLSIRDEGRVRVLKTTKFQSDAEEREGKRLSITETKTGEDRWNERIASVSTWLPGESLAGSEVEEAIPNTSR